MNYIIKNILIVFFLFLGWNAFSQTNCEWCIYQIQLEATSGDLDFEKYHKLRDLGLFYTNSIAYDKERKKGISRIYIGKYLGYSTAKRILDRVKGRGFKNAFLERDDYTLLKGDGPNKLYTIQLVSYNRKIKMYKLDGFENVYLQYKKGSYHVLLGFYDEFTAVASLDGALEELKHHGFPRAYIRQFRK